MPAADKCKCSANVFLNNKLKINKLEAMQSSISILKNILYKQKASSNLAINTAAKIERQREADKAGGL